VVPSFPDKLRINAKAFAEVSVTDDFFEFFKCRPGMFGIHIIDGER
jgi:hypothetical protein